MSALTNSYRKHRYPTVLLTELSDLIGCRIYLLALTSFSAISTACLEIRNFASLRSLDGFVFQPCHLYIHESVRRWFPMTTPYAGVDVCSVALVKPQRPRYCLFVCIISNDAVQPKYIEKRVCVGLFWFRMRTALRTVDQLCHLACTPAYVFCGAVRYFLLYCSLCPLPLSSPDFYCPIVLRADLLPVFLCPETRRLKAVLPFIERTIR